MKTLQGLFESTVEVGQGSTVLLRGEAGIGKTRLVDELVDDTRARYGSRGVLVGYGQCLTHSSATDAHQPIRDCLRSLLQSADTYSPRGSLERLRDALKLHAPDWAEAVPGVGSLLAAGLRTKGSMNEPGPTVLSESPQDQILRFIEIMAADTPMLLVVDDLHCADPATLQVLVATAATVTNSLMLVLSFRTAEANAEPESAQYGLERAVFRLQRLLPDCVELELQKLTGNETRELITNLDALRNDRSPDDLEAIVTQSGGVPLFAESLWSLRSERDPTAARRSRSLLTSVVDERLGALTRQERALLETAALVGPIFEIDYVAALLRQDLDETYDQVDALMRDHRLLTSAARRADHDRYKFEHPLILESLTNSASENQPRWIRTHARLFGLLARERTSWDDEQLARAASTAATAQLHEQAAELNLLASRGQLRSGAVTRARRLADTAISHASEDGSIVTTSYYLQLIDCLSSEGSHVRAALVCADALKALGSEESFVESIQLRLRWARHLRMVNAWGAVAGQLRQLREQLNDHDPELFAEVKMLEAEVALCGPSQNIAHCIRLTEEVEHLSLSHALKSRALGHRGLAHLAAYRVLDAEQHLTAAVREAAESDDPYHIYEAVHWLSKKALACLEILRAEELLARLESVSTLSGVASESPFHLRDKSRVAAMKDDIESSVGSFAAYFDLSADHAIDRAAATLLLQARELIVLHGQRSAQGFLEGLYATAGSDVLIPQRAAFLADCARSAAETTSMAGELWSLVATLGIDADEAKAADAIFRFDVPNLDRLRS